MSIAAGCAAARLHTNQSAQAAADLRALLAQDSLPARPRHLVEAALMSETRSK